MVARPAGRVLVAGLVVCPAGRVARVLPTAVPRVFVPVARTALPVVLRVAAPRADTMRPLLSLTIALPRDDVPETVRPAVVPRTAAVRVFVRP